MRRLWLCLLLPGCGESRPLPTPIAVHQGPFVVDVRTLAVVQPLDSHPITLPQGLWDSNIDMLAKEGKRVKAGELIASVTSRQVIDNLLARQDELANEQATLDRARANAPVRQWEVQQDIMAKDRARHEKQTQEATVARGGAPEVVAAARKDLALSELALTTDLLAAKEQLYEKGAIGKQELAEARRDHDLDLLARQAAQLSLGRLAPGAQAEDVAKARLTTRMADAAYERARIEAPAKRDTVRLEQDKNRVRISGLGHEVKGLKAKVDAARVYAPADGMVVYPLIWNWKKPYVGMGVWPGLVFLSVARLDAVKLLGAVSEADIARMRVGLRAEVTADGYPGRVFAAHVTQVSKLAKEEDERGGVSASGVKRFDLELRPDKPAPELVPNMRVHARVVASSLASVCSVPQEALFGPEHDRYVWLESPTGPRKQPVKVTGEAADWVALATALPPASHVYLVDPTQPLDQPGAPPEKTP